MGTEAALFVLAATAAASTAKTVADSRGNTKGPDIPLAPQVPEPKAADTASFNTAKTDADRLAQSAGGTIKSGQGQVSDGSMGSRKTLLGS